MVVVSKSVSRYLNGVAYGHPSLTQKQALLNGTFGTLVFEWTK